VKASHDLWFLSFERMDNATDAARRAHVRQVLAEYGLEEFFDEGVSNFRLTLFNLRLAFSKKITQI
jgi:hypothetical protein